MFNHSYLTPGHTHAQHPQPSPANKKLLTPTHSTHSTHPWRNVFEQPKYYLQQFNWFESTNKNTLGHQHKGRLILRGFEALPCISGGIRRWEPAPPPPRPCYLPLPPSLPLPWPRPLSLHPSGTGGGWFSGSELRL